MYKLKRMFRWILNRKVADLNNDGKVDTLREEISGVFSQFKQMNDKLEEVNVELEEIAVDELSRKEAEREAIQRMIEASNLKLAKSDEVIAKAKKEQEANKKLQEKVQEFIVM